MPRIRSPSRSVSRMFSPHAGSSSSRRRGSQASARAISTMRCRPKGRLRASAPASSATPKRVQHLHGPLARRALVAPGRRQAQHARERSPSGRARDSPPSRSRARSCPGRAGSPGRCARCRVRRPGGRASRSRPGRRMRPRPENGGKLPATRLKSVDLPAPLGPMIALTRPARHEKPDPVDHVQAAEPVVEAAHLEERGGRRGIAPLTTGSARTRRAGRGARGRRSARNSPFGANSMIATRIAANTASS